MAKVTCAAGLTLVEVMVAMLVLAVALIGLAAAIPPATFGVSEGGFQATATGLAQEKIEEAHRIAYGSLSSLVTSRGSVAGFPGFEREVLVNNAYTPAGCGGGTPCATACASNRCTQIVVRVYFASPHGDVQTTLTTVRSQTTP